MSKAGDILNEADFDDKFEDEFGLELVFLTALVVKDEQEGKSLADAISEAVRLVIGNRSNQVWANLDSDGMFYERIEGYEPNPDERGVDQYE